MKKCLIFFFISSPFWLSAQGYQVNAQGQTQQAMGNTGTGFIQDASAVFFNPGGMSFLKENSVSLGGNAAIVKSAVLDSVDHTLTNTKTPVSVPFTLYAVYGVDSSMGNKQLQKFKFGMGVYTPFGLGVTYPSGWSGAKILNSLSIQTIFIQPTVSYKFNDKLGIGVGFVYGFGSITRNQDLPQFSSGLNSTVDLKGNMHGYGFNTGVYYQATKALSIGLTYRSQVTMDVTKGTATFKNIPSNLTDSIVSGSFKTSMPMPWVISLGGAYKVNDKLTLAADINYIGFKLFDTLRVDLANNSTANPDIKSARNFHNTTSYHIGGQYEVMEGLSARIGLQYILSAVPNGYTTPEGADANRLVYSAGVGYKISPQFNINASYTFQRLLRTDNSLAYKFAATYKTYASLIGLSLSYNF
jgi:long-chain fatty acid transport protein